MVRTRGNALQEYGLIGALCILACISVLLALGGNLNTLMQDLKKDMAGHQAVAIQAKELANKQNLPALPPEYVQGSQSPVLTPKESLQQGSLATRLQTLGANGTTELLAKQLEDLAQSLYEKGEITEAQRNKLLDLANKGHEMAQVERMLEDYVTMASADREKYENMKIEFQGKSYTPKDLSKLIGINKVQPETITDFFREARDTGSLLADFQALYLEADQNGSLQSPEVKSLVTSAASQIVITGELMEHSYYKFHDGTDDDVSAMNERMISKATDINSWQICKSGNGMDDGTFCQ